MYVSARAQTSARQTADSQRVWGGKEGDEKQGDYDSERRETSMHTLK